MSYRDFLKNCATLGYIGYMPASGTIASLVTVPFAFLVQYYLAPWYLLLFIISYCSSYAILHAVLPSFAYHDPSEVVIDEFLGCLITFYALPCSWAVCIVGFLLFRFFDISKIGLVGWAERLPGAYGIILDDVMAGLLSNICIRLLFMLGLRSFCYA